jgi:TM2 domain-containing membrane protein YozV
VGRAPFVNELRVDAGETDGSFTSRAAARVFALSADHSPEIIPAGNSGVAGANDATTLENGRGKPMSNGTPKSWMVTLLLCFFLGTLGAHRFYTGKIGTGVAMLFTVGGCGIWTLIDFIMILMDKFTDADGQPLQKT